MKWGARVLRSLINLPHMLALEATTTSAGAPWLAPLRPGFALCRDIWHQMEQMHNKTLRVMPQSN